MPIVKKDSEKIKVCIDFRNLNKTTPKDVYPMPIADMLINKTSGHRIIIIFIIEEYMSKIVFRCLGFVSLFEWVVMIFKVEKC